MNAQTVVREKRIKQWFFMCPVRHVLCFLSLLVIGLYFALRGNHTLMLQMSERFVRPAHRVLGTVCNLLPFSVAELIYALLVIFGIVYIIYSIVCLIKKPERLKRLYRLLLTLAAAAAAFYAGFCLLWGVYYYGDSFTEKIGLQAEPISAEQLAVVTRYFAGIANETADAVERDEDGFFAESRDSVMTRGETLYRDVEQLFPALEGREFRPKPVLCSKIMSMLQFTGFFFPFTGEANLNMDSPACMLPATVAHELAHQRGVAKEQEANFAAVVACLESGDETFIYSASLLAYIHLGNALHDADYETWKQVYYSLDDAVLRDFAQKNAYWERYEDTPVSKASDAVYTGFLQSYGQTLGLKSYGACVDLLVAYYYEEALEAIQ